MAGRDEGMAAPVEPRDGAGRPAQPWVRQPPDRESRQFHLQRRGGGKSQPCEQLLFACLCVVGLPANSAEICLFVVPAALVFRMRLRISTVFSMAQTSDDWPIADAAEGPTVGLSPSSERGMAGAIAPGVRHSCMRPLVNGGAHPLRASLPHLDPQPLAAALGNQCAASQNPRGVTNSRLDGLMGHRKQHGDDAACRTWQTSQDRRVAPFALLERRGLFQGSVSGDLVELCIQSADDVLHLAVEEACPLGGGSDVRRGRRRARCDGQRRLLHDRKPSASTNTADAMAGQRARDLLLGDPAGIGWLRGEREQREGRVDGNVVSDLQRTRAVAPDLLVDAVGEPSAIRRQLLGQMRAAPLFEYQRGKRHRAAEAVTIALQSRVKDQRVWIVILGADLRQPIAEAVERPWVDGEDRNAAIQKCLEHWAVRRLDGDRNALALAWLVHHPDYDSIDAEFVVRRRPLHRLAIAGQADLVRLTGPINANAIYRWYSYAGLPSRSPPELLCRSLYGRSGQRGAGATPLWARNAVDRPRRASPSDTLSGTVGDTLPPTSQPHAVIYRRFATSIEYGLGPRPGWLRYWAVTSSFRRSIRHQLAGQANNQLRSTQTTSSVSAEIIDFAAPLRCT